MVDYYGKMFLGRVQQIDEGIGALVLCLSKEFGNNEPQEFERENDACHFKKIFKMPVEIKNKKLRYKDV